MKTLKIILAALLVCGSTFAAKADDDRPIAVDQLPAKSREFIQTYFKGVDVSYAKVDRDYFDRSYEVRFVNGTKVEFDSNGEWDSVDGHREKLPAGIVPAQIEKYVAKNHPGQYIVKIDRDRRSYEIELRNGVEIKFNRSFQVIGYDD